MNDKKPNFRNDDGQLYLVRCFACGGERGTENWAPSVASGTCAWCGWSEDAAKKTSRTDDLQQESENEL